MIALLDSGIGGLSIYAEIVRQIPHMDVLYYADTINCPYGNKSNEQIISLTTGCVRRIVEMNNIDAIVVACNTMTIRVLDTLRERFPNVPIIGTVPDIEQAINMTKTKNIGVLATLSTIQGERYIQKKKKIVNDINIVEIVGDGLVDIVEKQEFHSMKSRLLIEKYINEFQQKNVDTIVLGCTHFPFLAEIIDEITNKQIKLVSSAKTVTRNLLLELRKHRIEIIQQGNRTFISSKGAEDALRVGEIAQNIIFK